MSETQRDKALNGEVVFVTNTRLWEMQGQAARFEGVTATPVYHWHFAAALNELAWRREVMGSSTPSGRAEHE